MKTKARETILWGGLTLVTLLIFGAVCFFVLGQSNEKPMAATIPVYETEVEIQTNDISTPLPKITQETRAVIPTQEPTLDITTIPEISTEVPTPFPSPTVLIPTAVPSPTVVFHTNYGVPDKVDFNQLLGNKYESEAMVRLLQARGRQPNLVGFATWYYLPQQFNAYRTMFNENNCFVAVDASLSRDKNVGMHFALVVVDGPIPAKPFMAFVGDIGPLAEYQLAFTSTGSTVEVEYGGEPVVMDTPVGCFSNYINNENKTAHVQVYLLEEHEALEYLESLSVFGGGNE